MLKNQERELPVFMACLGNIVNNANFVDKKSLRDPRCICVHCQNFISIEVERLKNLGGGEGVHSTPILILESKCGSKHLGPARIKLSQ